MISLANSKQIRIPTHYQFGITSATLDNPDSFEVHKFTVTSLPPTPGGAPPVQQKTGQQQTMQSSGGQSSAKGGEIPSELPDTLAATIKSQEAQFEDLHNRLQILNHQVQNILKEVEVLTSKEEERWTQLMNRIIPVHDQVVETQQVQQRIEKIVNALQRDIEGKDYKETLTSLQNAVRDTHSSLMRQLPQSMNESTYYTKPISDLANVRFCSRHLLQAEDGYIHRHHFHDPNRAHGRVHRIQASEGYGEEVLVSVGAFYR